MTISQNRVAKGVPTGGQFAVTARGESQVDLTATDDFGALTESVERIRAQAYAEGRKQGFREAAASLHEWQPDLTDEISGYQIGSGYYSMNIASDDARDMTAKVLGQAQVLLQARGDAIDLEPQQAASTDPNDPWSFDDVPSPTESSAAPRLPEDWIGCRHCGQSGFASTYDGETLGECDTCNGHGAVPPTPLGQDTVEIAHWGTFHRRRDGVYPGTPYAMRFEANRPLTDDEVSQMAQLIGYRYRAAIRGESLGWPERDSAHSFVVAADTTKSRSDDLGVALEDFEDDLDGLIFEGSPVRTTDRAGAGTRGTRLVEGFNDPDLKVAIYYDDVTE
jgi:hypothetical protein